MGAAVRFTASVHCIASCYHAETFCYINAWSRPLEGRSSRLYFGFRQTLVRLHRGDSVAAFACSRVPFLVIL